MGFTCDNVSYDKSNVLPGGRAGSALSIGDLVFMDSNGAWQLAVALTLATALASRKNALGVMVVDALANEYVSPVRCARISGFTNLTVGAPVFLTATGTTGNTVSASEPAIGLVKQIAGRAVSSTDVSFDVRDEEITKFKVIAAGTQVTVNNATNLITVSGITVSDIAMVQVCSVGATPRTVSAADCTTNPGAITVTLSGAPSTDHKLSYTVVRPAS